MTTTRQDRLAALERYERRCETEDRRRERLADARKWAGYRSAHYARSTGTLVVVVDDLEFGMESDHPFVGRWATICDDHDRLVFHDTLATAKSQAADPGGWCGVCSGQEEADDD